MENFRPGTLAGWGLAEADIRRQNPRLIYASLSAFGASGPLKERPGYDLAIQAWGGLMSITGPAEGEPSKVGVAIIDIVGRSDAGEVHRGGALRAGEDRRGAKGRDPPSWRRRSPA